MSSPLEQENNKFTERKPRVDKLAAHMNEIENRRSTCDCCSDLEVDEGAAKLFDYDRDDPPEGEGKD